MVGGDKPFRNRNSKKARTETYEEGGKGELVKMQNCKNRVRWAIWAEVVFGLKADWILEAALETKES